MSRPKVPLNLGNMVLDPTRSSRCLYAARVYVANRTYSEIGLWQMGVEILAGLSANRKLTYRGLWGGSSTKAMFIVDCA